MKNIYKTSTVLIGVFLSISLFAQEKTAEDLVKSMKKEDITYRQLMAGIGMASNNIQTGFKSMRMFYNKKMDEDAEAIEKAVNKKDWQKALEASNKLSNSCLSCHVVYKDKVKYIME
jgi:type III secretory pathway component EscR